MFVHVLWEGWLLHLDTQSRDRLATTLLVRSIIHVVVSGERRVEGPICLRGSYHSACMCVSSHSIVLIVLARASVEVAPRRLVQWLGVGALHVCELTQPMSFNL